MVLKTFIKALVIKLNSKLKMNKGLSKSYVSLFLVVVLVAGSTTAWFSTKDFVNIESQILTMDGSSGITDNNFRPLQTKVRVDNFRMEEASSVDGRNIYFPASFTKNVSDNDNSNMDTQTDNMVFREGNAGDKNTRYAYADTTISASGGDTDVWVKGYNVEIKDPNNPSDKVVYQDEIQITYNGDKPVRQEFNDSCPIRIAIIDDSGHTPKVFDPSARIKDYAENTSAIYSVGTAGSPQRQQTALESFSTYYYGGNTPLFTVAAGTTISLTVVVWLEGTHPRASEYEGKEVTFEIEVETNVSQMEKVYLHDWTIGDNTSGVNSSNYFAKGNESGGQWLSGNVVIAMQYYDKYAEKYKTTIMTADGTDSKGRKKYVAAIPSYVQDKISFYRLSSTDEPDTSIALGTIYNAWHTYNNVNNALSSVAQGWRMLGNLPITRSINSTSTSYVHYYALRGNGYGQVDHTDTNRFEKWLSPCIGYWGNSSGPVSTN